MEVLGFVIAAIVVCFLYALCSRGTHVKRHTDPVCLAPKEQKPENANYDRFPKQRTSLQTNIPRVPREEVIYDRNSTEPHELLEDAEIPEYYAVDDFREKARYHHEQRILCFEMASSAYSCGDGAGAKHYSTKGHAHTRLMEEANEDALNLLIEQCEPALQQTNTLDLHGFFVNEGLEYLDEVVQEREEAFTRGKEYLTVITGKGLHSDGRIKLRPALIDYLNKGKYRYIEESRGVFKFKLHPRTLQNTINTRRNNEHSHPMTKKVKQRYLNKKKNTTSVKNRFSVLHTLGNT